MIGEPLEGRIYQAVPEFEADLMAELGGDVEAWGPLIRAAPAAGYWASNAWLEPFRLEFGSVSEAAAALRSVQRNWAHVPVARFRRAELIKAKLPPIAEKARPFPWLLPDAPMGAWSLLDDHTLVGSARCSSPFPGGRVEFEEDKLGPPSRAYLKLREALVRARAWPRAGERCLDAGACPGGWTWVLAGLGARVTAVDRAPLDPRIMAMEGVEFVKHDAFTLKPEELGPFDWICSDVICYPPRLLEWVELWLASGLCRNFVCTIKMQGEWDRATTARFAELGTVVHLCANKHELTWIKVDN